MREAGWKSATISGAGLNSRRLQHTTVCWVFSGFPAMAERFGDKMPGGRPGRRSDWTRAGIGLSWERAADFRRQLITSSCLSRVSNSRATFLTLARSSALNSGAGADGAFELGYPFSQAGLGHEHGRIGRPARAASELERPVQRRNPIGVEQEFDGPRGMGDAADKAPLFEPDQHGVHRRRREVEEPLEVCMSGP